MAGILDPSYGDSIAAIESGGKYDLLGPVTKSGDRAYGKYQVMGTNIPEWTKEVLGAPMSPQEFAANPQAQEAVFDAKFGQYVQKYGPEGAAQAWFGGPGAVGKTDRKDQLGTSVGSYGQRFMAGIDKPQQTANTDTAQPLGAPMPIAPQQPLQPQPLNLGQSPASSPYGSSPQSPVEAGMPPLNAPQLQQIARRFNLQQAFSRIPTPAGFRGFTYG